MHTDLPDLLPHRLNFDAIVFCGCTMKEIQRIALGSLIFCSLLLGVLMKALIGMFLVGVGIAFPTAVGMSWCIALLVQKAKQGKPKGYMKQKLLIWFAQQGWYPDFYVRRSGKWSIGRRLT